MGVNSFPKTVTRQRRGCDFNPGPTSPESSTLTTRLQCQPEYAWSYMVTERLHSTKVRPYTSNKLDKSNAKRCICRARRKAARESVSLILTAHVMK